MPATATTDMMTNIQAGWFLRNWPTHPQNDVRSLLLREIEGEGFLVVDEAPLELVDAAAVPVVMPVVYCVPLAPIVGNGTLPLTSHIPLVKGGQAGGFVVGE